MRFRDVVDAGVLIARMGMKNPEKAVTLLISGPPGTAKSSAVFVIAKELDTEVGAIIRPGIKEPTDFCGIPVPVGEFTCWLKPEIVRHLAAKKKPGIILIDDYGQGVPATQNALAPLIQTDPDGTRHIGEHEIPAGWIVFVTTNRKKDKAAVHAMPTFVRDRMVEIEMTPHWEDFEDFIVKARWSPKVLAFHRNTKGTKSYTFNPDNPEDQGATWRGWDRVQLIEKELDEHPVGHHVVTELVVGSVGQAAGRDYMAYRTYFDKLPDMQRIFRGLPTKHPEEGSLQYATVTLLGLGADKQNLQNVLAWAEGLPAEHQAVLVSDIEKRWPEVAQHPAMQTWRSKHSSRKDRS